MEDGKNPSGFSGLRQVRQNEKGISRQGSAITGKQMRMPGSGNSCTENNQKKTGPVIIIYTVQESTVVYGNTCDIRGMRDWHPFPDTVDIVRICPVNLCPVRDLVLRRQHF